MPSITVAILAGGRGTRIASLAGNRPKALVPVNGKPFLHYQLSWLKSVGVQNVVLCVGYEAQQIKEFAGNGDAWGLRIAYSDDGIAPLGTGGAVLRALPLLGDTFATLYGDAILQCAPSDVYASLRRQDDGVMAVYENCDRLMRSNVCVADGFVTRYDKNAALGTMNFVDYGISVLRAKAFDVFDAKQTFDLAALHTSLIEKRTLRAFVCTKRWYEVGSPDGLLATEAFLSKGRAGNVER